MSRKDRLHKLIHDIANEIFDYIKEEEAFFPERWVPSSKIKNELGLNFVAVPLANKQYGSKGWLFAITARLLEDEDLLDYKKVGNRAYYRSK